MNDEYGDYKMSKDQKSTLGLSNKQLRDRLNNKHHQICHRFNSGYGLTLQYEDSKIAERVILLLLEQDIACLPMHDSFIVQATERSKVVAAMTQAYRERFGVAIDLKSTFLFDNDDEGRRKHPVEFLTPFDVTGNVDHSALFQIQRESLHNQYCYSWLASGQRQVIKPSKRERH